METPRYMSSWMQEHLSALADQPLREICLPASHDAATYKILKGTFPGGTEGNVLTQTKTIYEQLMLGARWFDIRPCLWRVAEGNEVWATHHSTDTGAFGIQGGITAALDVILDDVNRFTRDCAELVVLRMSHYAHLEVIDESSAMIYPLDASTHGADLLAKLKQLENCFTMPGSNDIVLQDIKLNNFIGSGRAAVIVLMESGWINDTTIRAHGFFTESQYSVPEHSVTRMQSETEAGLSTAYNIARRWVGEPDPDAGNPWSVLNLTAQEQQHEFPFTLQSVLASNAVIGRFVIDDIKDDKLLTLALTVTFHQLNLTRETPDEPVVIFAGKRITDAAARDVIPTAMLAHTTIDVHGDKLGGDSWPAAPWPKSLGVYATVPLDAKYWPGLIQGRWALAGDHADFRRDILALTYNSEEGLKTRPRGGVRRLDAYYQFWRALMEPGTYKSAWTTNCSDLIPMWESHEAFRTAQAEEGALFSF
ncbi:hypothetical protein BKA62DRAFT_833862 [Auriculariales sp. MPI-PUGE-AT-0066]|nr:hypothetical protein BKA62DRAFT_833862 [Auriculariales sp. MPI-PUGE-AT-0066]